MEGEDEAETWEEEVTTSNTLIGEGDWDEVASQLQSGGGVATIRLPLTTQTKHATSFVTARKALDLVGASKRSSSVASCQGTSPSSSAVTSDEYTTPTPSTTTSASASTGPIVSEIPDTGADPAHVTGYHSAGGTNSMSRYNEYREGFVFSDGGTLNVRGMDQFESSMVEWFDELHDIARNVMAAIERKMGIPSNWFEATFGPTKTSSQWHVKRYRYETDGGKSDYDDSSKKSNNKNNDNSNNPSPIANATSTEFGTTTANVGTDDTSNEDIILLPMHTDPSIISIVILDAEGCQPLAMGLQCYASEKERQDRREQQQQQQQQNVSFEKDDGRKSMSFWKDVPFHGHAVATIFVGSVLSYITGGYWPSVKHRVICQQPRRRRQRRQNHHQQLDRMATTLFLRPVGTAIVQVPPTTGSSSSSTSSPWCLSNDSLTGKIKSSQTFHQWYARVSKNYGKKKKKRSDGKK